jgi:Flp pilus assembly protein TadG
VESALCFLGFMLLTVGVMEFGYAVYAFNFCSYAAQDAARWASVNGADSSYGSHLDNGDIQNYTRNLAAGLNSSNVTTQTVWGDDLHDAGSTVQVTVNYAFHPIAGLGVTQNVTLGSTANVTIIW